MERRHAALSIAGERGVALILALLATLALSALTASLMLLSRTETWSGMNYRMLAQTRYGAEAGLHQTVNYLLNSYTPPGSVADPISSYDTTVSPVTYNGKPVVLSSLSAVPSNYPVASVATTFNAGTPGTLADDTFNVAYGSYATLLSLHQGNVYGSTTTTLVTVMTWQITSDGSIAGPRSATQEVSAILEQQFSRPFSYAVFATGSGCNTLQLSAGGTVDSYDSATSTVVTQPSGGNVGTNGSLGPSTTATINGSLSLPRTGVGGCPAQPVPPTVTGGVIELPQTVLFPAPTPSTPPTGSVSLSTNCAGLPGCSQGPDGVSLALAPGSYPDLTITGGGVVHLTSGTYAINSLTLTGNSRVAVDVTTGNPAIINVAGQGQSVPLDFTGGTIVSASFNPAKLQIQYAGAGQINLTGTPQSAGVIYAPNAAIRLVSGSDWLGSIVTKTFDNPAGASIHFDRELSASGVFLTPGNWTLNSFTWKTY